MNSVMSALQRGVDNEPDIRQAELTVKELGLDHAKSVSTPCMG